MKEFDFNTKMKEAFGLLAVSHPNRHQMTPKVHFQPVSYLVDAGHIQVDFSSDLIHFPILSILFYIFILSLHCL